jgi:hypothetical protein
VASRPVWVRIARLVACRGDSEAGGVRVRVLSFRSGAIEAGGDEFRPYKCRTRCGIARRADKLQRASERSKARRSGGGRVGVSGFAGIYCAA